MEYYSDNKFKIEYKEKEENVFNEKYLLGTTNNLVLRTLDFTPTNQNTVFVSKEYGSDANDGTEANPVKSINKALEISLNEKRILILDNEEYMLKTRNDIFSLQIYSAVGKSPSVIIYPDKALCDYSLLGETYSFGGANTERIIDGEYEFLSNPVKSKVFQISDNRYVTIHTYNNSIYSATGKSKINFTIRLGDATLVNAVPIDIGVENRWLNLNDVDTKDQTLFDAVKSKDGWYLIYESHALERIELKKYDISGEEIFTISEVYVGELDQNLVGACLLSDETLCVVVRNKTDTKEEIRIVMFSPEGIRLSDNLLFENKESLKPVKSFVCTLKDDIIAITGTRGNYLYSHNLIKIYEDSLPSDVNYHRFYDLPDGSILQYRYRSENFRSVFGIVISRQGEIINDYWRFDVGLEITEFNNLNVLALKNGTLLCFMNKHFDGNGTLFWMEVRDIAGNLYHETEVQFRSIPVYSSLAYFNNRFLFCTRLLGYEGISWVSTFNLYLFSGFSLTTLRLDNLYLKCTELPEVLFEILNEATLSNIEISDIKNGTIFKSTGMFSLEKSIFYNNRSCMIVENDDVNIKYNLFYSNNGQVIEVDGAGENIVIEHNTLTKNESALKLVSNNGQEKIKNNIFYNNAVTEIDANSEINVSYSINNGGSVKNINIIEGINFLDVDPLFQDEFNNNYNIKSVYSGFPVNSPALFSADDEENIGCYVQSLLLGEFYKSFYLPFPDEFSVSREPVLKYENQTVGGGLSADVISWAEIIDIKYSGIRRKDAESIDNLLMSKINKREVRIFWQPFSSPDEYFIYVIRPEKYNLGTGNYQLDKHGVKNLKFTLWRSLTEK